MAVLVLIDYGFGMEVVYKYVSIGWVNISYIQLSYLSCCLGVNKFEIVFATKMVIFLSGL